MKRAALKGRAELLKPIIVELIIMNLMLEDKKIADVYATPVTSFQESVVFAPQVSLYFLEKREDQIDKSNPLIDGLISFRLLGQTSEKITKNDVDILVEKVKAKFATPPFVWNKGKKCYSYYDKSKGYRLKINSPSEDEAKRIIEQVLDLQGHSPDWEFLNLNQAVKELEKFDETPRTKIILGNPHKQVRRRPVGKVTFYRAELHVHGIKPIVLYPVPDMP